MSNNIYDLWKPNVKWYRYADVASGDVEGKEQLARAVYGVRQYFDHVRSYINEELEAIEREEESSEDYTDTAWSHKQASRNGRKAALKKVRDFLPPK